MAQRSQLAHGGARLGAGSVTHGLMLMLFLLNTLGRRRGLLSRVDMLHLCGLNMDIPTAVVFCKNGGDVDLEGFGHVGVGGWDLRQTCLLLGGRDFSMCCTAHLHHRGASQRVRFQGLLAESFFKFPREHAWP